MDKTIYKKKTPAFKVHLLEQESIRTLYRNRLKGKLTPLTREIDLTFLFNIILNLSLSLPKYFSLPVSQP
jgi:antibiotic biosynthesis monooxygenase (ABM) superfamily enzyme